MYFNLYNRLLNKALINSNEENIIEYSLFFSIQVNNLDYFNFLMKNQRFDKQSLSSQKYTFYGNSYNRILFSVCCANNIHTLNYIFDYFDLHNKANLEKTTKLCIILGNVISFNFFFNQIFDKDPLYYLTLAFNHNHFEIFKFIFDKNTEEIIEAFKVPKIFYSFFKIIVHLGNEKMIKYIIHYLEKIPYFSKDIINFSYINTYSYSFRYWLLQKYPHYLKIH